MQCPGKYLKGIVEFLCSKGPHDSIDKSWPVTDFLSLLHTPQAWDLSNTRQSIPFWGSLLSKLCFCSFDVPILITFHSSSTFASWSCAEHRPLLLSLVPGLRAEEQLCFMVEALCCPTLGILLPSLSPSPSKGWLSNT